MAEILCVPSRNGSWSVQLDFIDLSPSDLPPEGLLQLDLRFTETCKVVSMDENGNALTATETDLPQITIPTIHFPGNLNRRQYYPDLLEWLQLKYFNLPLKGDIAKYLTKYMIDSVFQSVEVGEKLAMRVFADLRYVSMNYKEETDEDESDSDSEETDEDEVESDVEDFEDEEEEKGLSENCVQTLRDLHVIPAAEEHRKLGDCSICFTSLVSAGDEEKEDLFKSPCGHVFHDQCMSTWLSQKDSCPLCRSVVSSEITEDVLSKFDHLLTSSDTEPDHMDFKV